jgi:hypothetical protein
MLRMDAWDRLLKSKRDGQLLIPILALCGDQNGESPCSRWSASPGRTIWMRPAEMRSLRQGASSIRSSQ